MAYRLQDLIDYPIPRKSALGRLADELAILIEQEDASVSRLDKDLAGIEKTLRGEMDGELSKQKAVATALLVMRKTGMRVGGGETDGKPTYAVSTLQKRHVTVSGDTVTFNFRGKSGVEHDIQLTDAGVARSVRAFQAAVESDTSQLFAWSGGSLSRKMITARLKEWNADYKPKDLRSIAAREVISEVGRAMAGRKRKAGSPEELKVAGKEVVKQIGDAVSKKLGNTSGVALQSYTNPSMVEGVLRKLGFGKLGGNGKLPILTAVLGNKRARKWEADFY